jgi:hypothetical protein
MDFWQKLDYCISNAKGILGRKDGYNICIYMALKSLLIIRDALVGVSDYTTISTYMPASGSTMIVLVNGDRTTKVILEFSYVHVTAELMRRPPTGQGWNCHCRDTYTGSNPFTNRSLMAYVNTIRK